MNKILIIFILLIKINIVFSDILYSAYDLNAQGFNKNCEMSKYLGYWKFPNGSGYTAIFSSDSIEIMFSSFAQYQVHLFCKAKVDRDYDSIFYIYLNMETPFYYEDEKIIYSRSEPFAKLDFENENYVRITYLGFKNIKSGQIEKLPDDDKKWIKNTGYFYRYWGRPVMPESQRIDLNDKLWFIVTNDTLKNVRKIFLYDKYYNTKSDLRNKIEYELRKDFSIDTKFENIASFSVKYKNVVYFKAHDDKWQVDYFWIPEMDKLYYRVKEVGKDKYIYSKNLNKEFEFYEEFVNYLKKLDENLK